MLFISRPLQAQIRHPFSGFTVNHYSLIHMCEPVHAHRQWAITPLSLKSINNKQWYSAYLSHQSVLNESCRFISLMWFRPCRGQWRERERMGKCRGRIRIMYLNKKNLNIIDSCYHLVDVNKYFKGIKSICVHYERILSCLVDLNVALLSKWSPVT